MGKKARLKAIKNLANRLPMINQTSTEKHFYTGAEILEWDTVKEIDGQPINPGKLYEYRSPVLMIQNNRRKMKKAYLKNGPEGIRHFLSTVTSAVEHHYKS